MLVNFTKMHSLGNDFIVIDGITQSLRLHTAHIKKIANRNFGIGCDQVLIIEPPMKPEADFYYRIYNSDGHEVEQCVNGARCSAQFVVSSELINKTKIVAECLAGQVTLSIRENNLVNVDFGNINVDIQQHSIQKPKIAKEIYTTSLGNPHGICLVSNISDISVAELGRELSLLPCFAHETNITFMQIIDQNNVDLRTFERGAGLTHACGSGACAAMIVGQHIGLLADDITANFMHGKLNIHLDKHKNLQQCGPVASVYIGKFRI